MKTTMMAAAVAALVAAPALAADACKDDGELVFAVVPAENAQGSIDRFTPTADYLTGQLGTKVTLRVASDYAAVIEGHKAGNIHIGWHGPGSFARAYQVTGGNVTPFAAINNNGAVGYYSVIYVKADSPYQSLADLKGKKFGLVDPNSTSGNFALRFFMDRDEKITPETYFSDVVFTGSHENAVIAVQQGTVDAAGNWWDNEEQSNLRQMEKKGMVKYDDFRIVWKSPLLAGSPLIYVNTLSEGCKTAIQDAFIHMTERSPETYAKFNDGKGQGFLPVKLEDYRESMAMIEYVDALRKKQ
ncbi:MAG: phosphonate ABC transporter substrate-binding protein [Gemmobacter sp.]|uniref:phosphonate ABC transporter substrate-binding protein n=1 Tax=Gemmobacter sp. TaxID=1898957 RepID=UPI00391D944D